MSAVSERKVFLLGRSIHKLTEQLILEKTLRVHLVQSPSLDQNSTLFQTKTILLSKVFMTFIYTGQFISNPRIFKINIYNSWFTHYLLCSVFDPLLQEGL